MMSNTRDKLDYDTRGQTNKEMVADLKQRGLITDHRVEEAMTRVNRANYAPYNPYETDPFIEFGARSAPPEMHANALQVLKDHLRPGARVLDVGCGSGYLTACMAHLVRPNGLVIGVDNVREMVEKAMANIGKDQRDAIQSGLVKLFVGDGRAGVSSLAPFDVIHVGGAIPGQPKQLIDQLKPGGRMLVPIVDTSSGRTQKRLEQIDKLPNGQVVRGVLMPVDCVVLSDR